MKCKRCHRNIPADRLKAVPDAEYCVSCMALHDVEPLTASSDIVREALLVRSLNDVEEMYEKAMDAMKVNS